MQLVRQLAVCAALLSAASGVCAAEFVSVSEPAAVLYDAPSQKATKLHIISRHMPLEKVVALDAWIKVRDSGGTMAWIEKSATSATRYVAITAEQADVRQTPADNSAIVAHVMRDVALEWLESSGDGWVKVRHEDGVTGYVKVTDVWGN